MKHLSIDLGDVRIGLATSDIMGIIATGLETYRRVDPDKDIDYIAKLVKDLGVEVVVIGLPVNMDGSSGERVQKAKEFGQMLSQKVSAKIDYQDERLRQALDEKNANKSSTR